MQTHCRQFGLALVAAATLGLAGCASMSPEECQVANWVEQGYADGRNGYTPTRITEHRKACAEVGVVPDGRRYRQGWDRGVLEYCTPANGVSTGRAGQAYRNVCPAHLEGPFVYWHQRGMEVYQAQRSVDDLDRQAAQARHQIDKEKDATRRRSLQRDLGRMERELRDARRELARAERRLR